MNRTAIALSAVLILGTICRAEPPSTLTAGGSLTSAVSGVAANGAVWRVYAVTGSGVQATGSAGAYATNVWAGDIVTLWGVLPPVGTEFLCVFSKEAGNGTLTHTGYCAVVNHVLTGDDPVEFSAAALRSIPALSAPSATRTATGCPTTRNGSPAPAPTTLLRGSSRKTWTPPEPT